MRLAVFVIVSSWKASGRRYDRPAPGNSSSGRVAIALGGAVARLPARDAAGAPAVGEEADRPAQEHDQPVLEPDQGGQVDAHPKRPGPEAGDGHALDIGDRLHTADPGPVSLVAGAGVA